MKNRKSLTENELMFAKGKGIVKEFGMDMCTLLYLKWITNKDLCIAQGVLSMLCGSLDGREVWGRMGKCVCVPESLCYSLKTITTLLNDYNST